MGMQVSCRMDPEMSEEDALRPTSEKPRRCVARSGPAKDRAMLDFSFQSINATSLDIRENKSEENQQEERAQEIDDTKEGRPDRNRRCMRKYAVPWLGKELKE